MAQITFDQTVNTTTEKQLVEAPRQLAATVPLAADQSEKGLIGDWSMRHQRLPRINLVNKSGQLADMFTPGTWIINKEHQVTTLDPKDKKKGQPLRVIAMQMFLQFQENISYDARNTTPARIFNSEAEVLAAGGSVGYRKMQGVFSEIATVEFLVKAGDAVSDEAEVLFCEISEDGDRYARVVATFGGTAFGTIAVPLATSLRTHLAETGIKGGQWDLGSALVSKAENSWWTPTIRSAGHTTEDQKRLVATLR
jgi:hypothetical protein